MSNLLIHSMHKENCICYERVDEHHHVVELDIV